MSEENKKTLSTFKGRIKTLYGGDSNLRSGLGVRGGYSYSSSESLAEKVKKARSASELRDISIEAKSNQGYADIINFFKTMYLYRYTVVPVLNHEERRNSKPNMAIKVPKGERDLIEVSRQMLAAVDSANIESIFPNILEIGLFEGYATVYLERSGDILSTYILPNAYSEPFLESNYGTTTVVFDLSYFDEIINNLQGGNDLNISRTSNDEKRASKEKLLLKSILDFYPRELRNAYLSFKGYDKDMNEIKGGNAEKGEQYIQLDVKKAAIIPFSPSRIPPKIKVTVAEETYDEASETQATKNKAGLEKILTHEIPKHDGELIVEYNEIKAAQDSMTKALSGEASVKVLTTFGKTELHQVQDESDVRSTVVKDAMDAQYWVAAMNPEMFRANTDYALKVSLGRNASFVWDVLQKIMNFYNLSINQQFNFGDYKAEITLLPITVYDEEEKVNAYRRGAEYGIGKLEAIVATGQKQSSLLDKLELEKALRLDDLLTPLQSSHTRSANENSEEKEIVKKEVDDPSEKVEEEEINTDEVKDEH